MRSIFRLIRSFWVLFTTVLSESQYSYLNSVPLSYGSCICKGDPIFMDRTVRIGEQLIDSRIKGEIGWMLEPWQSGPPYSVAVSYPAICKLALFRLGCPEDAMLISNGIVNGTSVGSYTCKCGPKGFDAGSRVQVLICDKVNEATLMELTVFSDPVTFSVELSIAIVLLVGKVGSLIASFLYLPPVIGFLLAGLGIQDLVSVGLIKGAGGDGPHSTPFGEMRIFALIIVLMRAGLTLKPSKIAQGGFFVILLSFLPYFAEFAVILGIGMYFLQWGVIDMGLLASILAALSPSLVIPGMIRMVHEKLGYTPRLVLTAAPIEVVLAIILFNIFANLELTSPNPLIPWVPVLSLGANIGLIPVNILFSVVLGSLTGYVVAQYIAFRRRTEIERIKAVLVDSTAEYLLAAILACYMLYALCTAQYIQQSSGVLAVFSMTLTMSEFCEPSVRENLAHGLAGLWVFVEIFLFTTTGINLSFKNTTGPAQSNRGVSGYQVSQLVGILFVGSLGRSAAILLIEILGYANLPPHRRKIKYLFSWWIATWLFQMPKATVQATLGGLPFAQHIIPGSVGLTRGLFIARATAFAVLLMAPIGVFLTSLIGKPLAEYLRQQDIDAGFLEEDEDDDKQGEQGEGGDSAKTAEIELRKLKYQDSHVSLPSQDEEDGERDDPDSLTIVQDDQHVHHSDAY